MDDRSHELIVKVVNYWPRERTGSIQLAEAQASGTVKVTTLASADLNAENSFAEPHHIAPESTTIPVNSGFVPVNLRPFSVSVFRVPVQ
jgi:alpha-L-arabinofuranosidase